MNRRLFLATALLAGVSGAAALAQTAPPVRVRGTIASLDGNTLNVKARDGQMLAIVLTDPLVVMTVKKAELSEIGPNTYIGTTTRTAADGKLTAIEVRIFPESMRGSGEGHRDWDLEPGSKMTNGTVTGAVTGASGRELTFGHKDGANTVFVPPSAGIMTYVTGARTDLKAGEVVFIAATKNAEGKWTAARVNVGKDGVAPMM
ncbi:MAG: hypothetical protein EXR07_07465 [Acetobacteraceae bacterium]|nr:hypothetical protein [Acetobacteraceae bacterium]